MFCPACKAEYRPGFTRCNDCDVELVEELPEEEDNSSHREADATVSADWRAAWAGGDQGECAAICDRLQENDIAFRVVEQPEDFFFGGAGQRFEVRVPPESLAPAWQIVQQIAEEIAGQGLPADDNAGEGETEDSLEQTEGDNEPLHDGDSDPYWDPRNWHPEEATEEVWSGDDPPQAQMIEVCLREHRIHSRTEILDDGSQQVLVMPEQESRARTIVREIVEGAPGR